ncbi:MAG: RHS repeat-associated core domain-containing protein [Lentisphaerales bacterium]|nr:RHS repeat-associated core domain-containing protein [Lentisphaerales bacterium]
MCFSHSLVPPATHFYHTDRQYNVRGLTDSNGAIVELYAYTPYGERTVMDATGTVIADSAYDNQYGFTGRYLDSETGLWYFRARYFSTEMGRFVSRDPLGYVDGMSLYVGYFSQHHGVDPSGLLKVIHTEVYNCGTITVTRLNRKDKDALAKKHGLDKGLMTGVALKFDFQRGWNCTEDCCTEYGWVQHVTNGMVSWHDNPGKKGHSDPTAENQIPKGGKSNPWYQFPNGNDGKPTPQETIIDAPTKRRNENFITQLVCTSTGTVVFEWHWSSRSQGKKK